MRDLSRKQLRRTTAIYWTLLLYIIAALVWWFISLNHQNDQMRDLQVNNLNARIDSAVAPAVFREERQKISDRHSINRSKYVGEGSTFFLSILIGAAFVYRAIRRQFRLQLQQENFMMAVTHELKTPISIARLNLETLQRYQLDPEKQKKIIRTALDETGRLNLLVNNILVASQLDAKGFKSAKDELDLSDLVKDCIGGFKSRFPDRLIREEVEPDATIKGDPLLLQMLINNLIENAIKYSPKEQPVEVSLKKIRSAIELQVRDFGPGIPSSETMKIFGKFYRIGNESTRKKPGTGLGLYLSRKIARDHNADISVTKNEPSGSNFTVIFHT